MTLEQFKELVNLLLKAGLKHDAGFVHVMITVRLNMSMKLKQLEDSLNEAINNRGDELSLMYKDQIAKLDEMHRELTTLGPGFDAISELLKQLLTKVYSELREGKPTGVEPVEQGSLATKFAEIGANIDKYIEVTDECIMTIEALQEEGQKEAPKSESTSYTSAYLDLIR